MNVRAATSATVPRAIDLHDPLTGLPNRTLLKLRLDQSLARCHLSGHTTAIVFADIDSFKHVNDTYGHHIGDQLLVAAGKRLSGLLRPSDTVARLAGDEFVILCEQSDDPMWIYSLEPRIVGVMGEIFVLSGIPVQTTSSVGIAVAAGFDGPGMASEELMRNADSAMYRAKGASRAARRLAYQ